ncbi:hypothetical protein EVAR_40020_1 [Eumeta japonica]|uniref:Uncharacterized protein n=1 Tax=Eumeta variegata TaxID=151549 RepID=A0A4C1YSG0_EUMVA|nr:hypothetical protein EVAR_40020_1 [Eumeta japonica]
MKGRRAESKTGSGSESKARPETKLRTRLGPKELKAGLRSASRIKKIDNKSKARIDNETRARIRIEIAIEIMIPKRRAIQDEGLILYLRGRSRGQKLVTDKVNFLAKQLYL